MQDVVFCYRRLFLRGRRFGDGALRCGASMAWPLRSPIREMPRGLDPFGAPGF